MELSSSLPLDILALVDPATRGAAPPLDFKQGDASSGGSALPFELCLELLEPVVPSGEILPPPGNPLPVVLDDDAAVELDAAETLALALPGLLPAPLVVTAPPAAGSSGAAAAAPTPSLVPSAALAPQAQPASTGAQPTVAAGTPQNLAATQSAVSAAAPGSATEAQDPTPPPPAAAAANTWLAALADTGTDMPAAPPPPAATPPAAPPSAVDSGATVATAHRVTADADYAAEAAVVAPRSEPGAGARRDEPSRGAPRMAWRDALAANTVQPQSAPSAAGAADTPEFALPTSAPVATPFVAVMRADTAALGTSAAPVAEAGAAPGGHSALHAATTQHSSATAQAAATATPDRAPVDTTTPRWQEAFASRVQWLADQKVGEANIRLNPPDLGVVDVKISLVEDRTFVQLTTHTTAARDELAQSLPRLRELFAASGLDLGGASVATGRDGQERYDGAPADQTYLARQAFASDGDQAAAAAIPSRRSVAGASRIDLFA